MGPLYIGHASGWGNPLKVLWNRIRKNHHIAKENPHLRPELFTQEVSKRTAQAAEGVWLKHFSELAKKEGRKMLNDNPALGMSRDKLAKSWAKLQEYIENPGVFLKKYYYFD